MWIFKTSKKIFWKYFFPFIQDTIAQLKVKLANNAKECDERNRVIKEVILQDLSILNTLLKRNALPFISCIDAVSV